MPILTPQDLRKEVNLAVKYHGYKITDLIYRGKPITVGSSLVLKTALMPQVLIVLPHYLLITDIVKKRSRFETHDVLDLDNKKLDNVQFRSFRINNPPKTIYEQLLRTIPVKPTQEDQYVQKKEWVDTLQLYGWVDGGTGGFSWLSLAEPIIREARKAYYSGEGESNLTDQEFDYLEVILHELDPKNKLLQQIGTQVREKVQLPFNMGGMRKIYPNDSSSSEASNWINNRNLQASTLVISDKADGQSVLLIYKNGDLFRALSRGDSSSGQDITRHMNFIESVPKSITYKKVLAIRGELQIAKNVFEQKYAGIFKNPRNMVVGILNRKTSDRDLLKDVTCHVYSIMDSSLQAQHGYDLGSVLDKMTKVQQLQFLKANSFTTIPYKVIQASKLGDKKLEQLLSLRKDKSNYELDGVIVEADSPQDRARLGVDNVFNPKYAVAFKVNDDENLARTKVIEVQWNVSRHGYLIPKVKIEPVELRGVTISYATAHNAAYVNDNGLGPGAIIDIVRSGDVIPYISAVIEKATTPQLPDTSKYGNWEWGTNNVHIRLVGGMEDVRVGSPMRIKEVKALSFFFSTLGVGGFRQGLIARLYDTGHTTIPAILNMTIDDFLKIDKFQDKTARNVYDAIHGALENVELPLLAAASGIFGRGLGYERLSVIWNQLGNKMFNWKGKTPEQISATVKNYPGLSSVLATQFSIKVKDFLKFYSTIKEHVTLRPYGGPSVQSQGPLAGELIVFTGFRDKALEQTIQKFGGVVKQSMITKTTTVVYAPGLENSAKLKLARERGVKIMSKPKFIHYLDSLI